MTDIITIDLNPVILAKNTAGNFIVTAEAEKQVLTILEAQMKIEEIVEAVKLKLQELMNLEALSKVEGEKVIALKMFHGARYEVFDRDLALQTNMAVSQVVLKPNIKAIDFFVKKDGQLPRGIKLRERSESVTLKIRKEKEND